MELQEERIQQMLSIIHQVPMGLIETDVNGGIKQMNAKAVQLLLPAFMQYQLPAENIFLLLKKIAPGILTIIEQHDGSMGSIINKKLETIELQVGKGTQQFHFFFSVNQLADERYMFIFDDITETYEKEKLLNQVVQDKAVEQVKYELAAGLLHDIGNALVGFGSYLGKIKRTVQQTDVATLEQLKLFFAKQHSTFCQAIGEPKANAIIELLNGLITNQQAGIADVKKSITEQMSIITHIQEILSIQRQYVKGQNTERAPLNLKEIINDSVSMLQAITDKKGIEIKLDMPIIIPSIKGDRTKLMQVFLNLLKNATDAVAVNDDSLKKVKVSLMVVENQIEIHITDTGIGFEQGTGQRFFEKGITTKQEGTGLGLANCKAIIESHNGSIELLSKGFGTGATASIKFNLLNV